MFDTLGVLLYGLIKAGANAVDSYHENNRRVAAKKNKQDWYFDKNGRLRNPITGAKLNNDQIHEFFQPVSSEQQRMINIEQSTFNDFKERYDRKDRRYYDPRFTVEEMYVAGRSIQDLQKNPYKLHGVTLERAKEVNEILYTIKKL